MLYFSRWKAIAICCDRGGSSACARYPISSVRRPLRAGRSGRSASVVLGLDLRGGSHIAARGRRRDGANANDSIGRVTTCATRPARRQDRLYRARNQGDAVEVRDPRSRPRLPTKLRELLVPLGRDSGRTGEIARRDGAGTISSG